MAHVPLSEARAIHDPQFTYSILYPLEKTEKLKIMICKIVINLIKHFQKSKLIK